MHRYLTAFALAALPIAAIAATLVPSAIVASPSTYDGQTVTVSGTVSNYKTHQSTAGGEVARFDLCDSKCVVVIDRTAQTHADNSTATVTGKFHASLQRPKTTLTNVITVGF